MLYKTIRRKRRKARRAEAVAKRGGRCMKCGSAIALEFHHRNREENDIDISHIWEHSETLREIELSKCDLLCTECHKAETAKERDWGTISHGTITAYIDYGCRCEACRHIKAEYQYRNRRLRLNSKGEPLPC